MLTRILHNSPLLINFINHLELNLSKPQTQHVINIADSLLVCESRKTLSALHRQFVQTVDASNFADCLRISPWNSSQLKYPLSEFMIRFALSQAEFTNAPKIIHLSIDDSIGAKHKQTTHIEPVDFHFDPRESTKNHPRYKNGLTCLVLTLSIGEIKVTVDLRLYLRARTVRRINRRRTPEHRIPFRSKNHLAHMMLHRLQPLLPADYKIYVHFDSWYASARLLKFIHRQGWHTVCALKHNRKLDAIGLDHQARSLRHQRYRRITLSATDTGPRTYLVRELTGKLERLHAPVRVYITRRHYRDHHPKYFASTDLDLQAKEALHGYGRRWSCEVDNLYLKTQLGLCDFRVQSYEAVDRWCTIVHLAWTYIEWRFVQEKSPQNKCPSDIIRRHREEHAHDWLKGALEMVLETGNVEQVLERFIPLAR